MTNNNSGTAVDMYARYFPGEPYTTSFEPTPEQSAAMVRLTSAHTQNNTEAETLLMMLGVIPSESAFNPTARDAWTKAKPTVTESGTCKNGHARARYTFINSAGARRCRECHRISKRAGVLRTRERKTV